MEEVSKFIKTVCNVENPDVYDGCRRYVKFTPDEDQDWTNVQLANYISSELKTHLRADVENIQDTVINDRVVVMFNYKGFTGEIWDRYNSKGHHCWGVSV